MNRTPDLRVVVVGAGVIGLLTALECAAADCEVTIIERMSVPNTEASSHDWHRSVRALHPGDPGATAATAPCHRQWRKIESRLGGRFYYPVGALTALPPAQVASALAVLARVGAPAQALSGPQLRERYPHIAFPAGRSGVLEKNAGVLLADRVLECLARAVRELPAVHLLERRAAVSVDPLRVSAELADGELVHGDRLFVATGPWSRALAPRSRARDLRLLRQTVLMCRVPPCDWPQWAETPAVPALGTADGAWLVPPIGDTPLKVSAHEACRVVPEISGYQSDPERAAALAARFTELVPGFTADWVAESRDCYYLAAPGRSGALLAERGDGAVLAHAACGGGGFKSAPIVARAVADRFLGKPRRRTGLRHLDHPVRWKETAIPRLEGTRT